VLLKSCTEEFLEEEPKRVADVITGMFVTAGAGVDSE
jgi:hypothetical protein